MFTGQLAYLFFFLRQWRAPGGDKQLWRASLETTLTGERKGFADLEALARFCVHRSSSILHRKGTRAPASS